MEMTSEAKLLSGFSNSSKVGNVPNTPQDASKNSNVINANPPKKSIQIHLVYFLKMVLSDLFLLIYYIFFNS